VVEQGIGNEFPVIFNLTRFKGNEDSYYLINEVVLLAISGPHNIGACYSKVFHHLFTVHHRLVREKKDVFYFLPENES